jgi:hypothetical protein
LANSKTREVTLRQVKTIREEDEARRLLLSINISAEAVMMMKTVDDIVEIQQARVMWKSKDRSYAADGIIMPISTDPKTVPIYVVEVSVSSPVSTERFDKKFPGARDTPRISKDQSLLVDSDEEVDDLHSSLEGGLFDVIRSLKKKFGRPVRVVLVWDKNWNSIACQQQTYQRFPSTAFLLDDLSCVKELHIPLEQTLDVTKKKKPSTKSSLKSNKQPKSKPAIRDL